MNTIAARSISTLAVTGGLVLGGAAAAQASDHSHDADTSSHSQTSLGSPISIGGLVLGTQQSDASADGHTSDGHGDTSGHDASASQDASQSRSFLELKPITIDPTFGQEQGSTSSEHTTSHHDRSDRDRTDRDRTDRGDRSGRDVTRHVERTSKSSTAAGAPSQFDGFRYQSDQHDASASGSTSDRTGEDQRGGGSDEGRHQGSSTQQSESGSAQLFDLGRFLLNPFLHTSGEDHSSVDEHVSR